MQPVLLKSYNFIIIHQNMDSKLFDFSAMYSVKDKAHCICSLCLSDTYFKLMPGNIWVWLTTASLDVKGGQFVRLKKVWRLGLDLR